jgi:hypothetical protein
MAISAGLAQFKLNYQLCPIIFTSGISILIPGGMLPIISITQSLNFNEGLLSGSEDLDLDDYFANFVPVPGSTLINQQIGHYPFANQAVAANAVIAQPKTISMRMICPARGPSGWATKLASMTALQSAFANHNAQGGTYTVATPSWTYVNCVMTRMTDTSTDRSAQAQNTYQIDFEQPLLTLEDALQAESSLMAQISGGLPIAGIPSWTGFGQALGNPASLGVIGVQPAAGNFSGTQAAAPTAGGGGLGF